MSERCDREVFEQGSSVAVLDARKEDAEQWVQAVALVSGQRVDWHYSGGRVNVLYLGDHSKVLAAVLYLAPCLKGTVLGIYDEAGCHGPYRAGDPLPDDVIGVG
jgi:hypothetical protein